MTSRYAWYLRGRGSNLLRNDVVANPWIWGALALCTGRLLAAVFVSPLAGVLRVGAPTTERWLLIVVFGFAPLLSDSCS